LARMRVNERDAPIPVVHVTVLELLESTLNRG
jgi:hypothetical protein